MNKYELNSALSEIWKFINECNKYISDNKPWELKDDKKRLDVIMYNLVESLRVISILIEPFMPDTSVKINQSLGIPKQYFKDLKFGLLKENQIQKVGYLFTRIEEEKPMANKVIKQKQVSAKPVIQFPDFEKLDLRIGKVIKVENHPDADKLYVLQVDFGDHKRQIVAGLRLYYKPEEILHKKIIVIVNLQPVTLRGVESNGMLLAASKEDKVVLLEPGKDIDVGARVS
jgi:methionyl-tRNA synthetase